MGHFKFAILVKKSVELSAFKVWFESPAGSFLSCSLSVPLDIGDSQLQFTPLD